ncbi:hypothetical protein B0T22DRAFT_505337 [Podospora appendiculata]|uniref:Uncharacterized protein n=1 Tax=Podospora appendiculata TaxID=314037 RepID=A0AAE0XHD6_9PEZI|nr:hypothetical protein B0T22DRAFT_505337 [Podospora appendiculata]
MAMMARSRTTMSRAYSSRASPTRLTLGMEAFDTVATLAGKIIPSAHADSGFRVPGTNLRAAEPGSRIRETVARPRTGHMFPGCALPRIHILSGIIQVPLDAFTYQPGEGRGEDEAVIKLLYGLFEKDCRPSEWSHHVKGEVDAEIFNGILLALSSSEAYLRNTVHTGKYPQLPIRECILCLDGQQRIAAARRRFGTDFWWPVKLYRNRNVTTLSRQTKHPDGDICWRILQFHFENIELTENRDGVVPGGPVMDWPHVYPRKGGKGFKYEGIATALYNILSIPDKTQKGNKSPFQRLLKDRTQPARPLIETGAVSIHRQLERTIGLAIRDAHRHSKLT